MDTNTLATNAAQVIQQAVQAAQPTVNAINWNLIVTAISGLVVAMISGATAIFVARISSNTKRTVENSEVSKQAAIDTADGVKAIHVAVNSERTAMLDKVEKLRDEILMMAKEKAITEEKLRVAAAAVIPTSAFSNDQLKQIVEALKKQ